MALDTANPLGELGTDLQFKPGGNPYSDVTPAGLAASYGQTYNSALAANQQSYNNVISGYKSLAGNVAKILGQGGGWGVAQPAAQAIADTAAYARGGAIQNSINRGLGGSTAAVAAQRGANLDAMKAYGSLGAQLAQTNAGYTASLGQGMLGAMQNVNVPYPNAGEYASLYQQYGQGVQSQQNMALLAQQQQLQKAAGTRAANIANAYGRLPGGVSTPQAPRGGTFGSGSSGLTPGGFGLPSYGGNAYSGGGGGSASANGGGRPAPYIDPTIYSFPDNSYEGPIGPYSGETGYEGGLEVGGGGFGLGGGGDF